MRSDPDADAGVCTTQRELRQYLCDQGYDVTERQLERWRKEDCLPRPQRLLITGLPGSSWSYPACALPQALEMCRLQHVKRVSFDELRILLWSGGYAIPPERVRASLQQLIEQAHDELRRRGLAQWRDTLTVAERLARQALPHLSQTLLGRHLQRTLTGPDLASYLTMQFQLHAGGRPAFDAGDEYVTDAAGAPLDKPLTQLIVDVYGLLRAQTDTLGEVAKPWFPLDLASAEPGADLPGVGAPARFHVRLPACNTSGGDTTASRTSVD